VRDDGQRERILATTRALLRRQEHGRGITVGQVAAAAHASRATVYRYFPGKAALLRAAGAAPSEARGAASPRVRILEAALEVFGERGLHAGTLSEIAARAGLSVSGLHWHYKNKDELLADLTRYIPLLPTIEGLVAEAEGAAGGGDLEAQLTRFATVLLPLLERRRSLLRFLLLEAEVHPDVARLASAHTVGRGLPLLTRLFQRHAESGGLRPGPAQARAQAFMGMFAVLALLRPAFSSLLALDDQETAREYVQIMLRGVLAAPGKGDRG
jgi:AcrR family transcriptional regulator